MDLEESQQAVGLRPFRKSHSGLFAVPIVMLLVASVTLEREPLIALKQAEARVEATQAAQRSSAGANR
jgi:heme exporter protein D